MEFLQPVLGDELFNQVKARIDAYNGDPTNKDKQVKLADLSTGGYVSADKHNALATEASGYKAQQETLNGELTTLKNKKGTDEDTKAALAALQSKYDADTAELTGKVAAARFDGALEAALAKSGAKSTKALRALLDVGKIKLDGEELTGFDEQLTALKKEADYLFDPASAWGGRQVTAPDGKMSEVEEAFYARNPKLRPKD